MKKIFFVLLVVLAVAVPGTAFCQWGAYGGLIMPQGDLDDAGVGVGFTLGGQYFTPYSGNEDISWGGTFGFAMASGDESYAYGSWETDVKFIEIIPSARYDFTPGQDLSFFGQVGIGLNFVSADYEYSYSYDYSWLEDYGVSGSWSESDSDTEFGFTLGGGAKYLNYEGMLQYKSFGDAHYITLTVGYLF